MEWFNILGIFSGFIGSVILSAGLLKSKDQIKDENNTYFNGNPFTGPAELASQKYYIVGFGAMILGFSFSIAKAIAEQFPDQQITIAIFCSLAFFAIGMLGIALLYLFRIRSHENARNKFAKKMFASQVKTHIQNINRLKANSGFDFDTEKSKLIDHLKEKLDVISEDYISDERELIESYRGASNWNELIKIAQEFTKESHNG